MSTDRAWRYWGEHDPYFGVLTSDEFRRGNLNDEALARFFETGEEHLKHIFGVIRQHVDPSFKPTSAVDFGCGTGRIAIPLAKHCAVQGLDVSPAMLDELQRNAERAGVIVEALISNDNVTAMTGHYDLIHSCIVFQHIPVARGVAITKRLLRRLRGGGIAVLHYTYARDASPVLKALNWLRNHFPGAQMTLNALQRKPLFEPSMQMNSYDLNGLMRVFCDCGIGSVYAEHGTFDGYSWVTFYAQRGGDNAR